MSIYFEQLESNKKDVVESAKKKILDQFGNVKDSWLLNGLYDYYLSTNSTNAIVIFVHIREPHSNYLFDRLSESIGKNGKPGTKVQALTLLGHIVRNQPMWLYKLPEHQLLKDLLKLLKVEVEILPLISALLVLIVLITMIPFSLGDCLNDVFEIFSRLASWNFNPGKSVDEQISHLQVALYALFLRLYGMFPCNFLAYLRTQYKDKNKPVFIHTIKPMLESVKMNPSLITTSKDNETASERWRKMPIHDIIVECERFSLDVSDTFCAHDSCQLASGFRSRSGTVNSALETTYSLKNIAASMTGSERADYFTPSMIFNSEAPPITGIAIPTYVPQPEFTHDENVIPAAGSSPPEAAIEATPETTPILQEDIQSDSSTRAQPQSPLHKDKSPFKFSPETKSDAGTTSKPLTQPQSPYNKDKSLFTFPPEAKHALSPSPQKMQPFVQDKPLISSTARAKTPPTTPLKVTTGAWGVVKVSPTKSTTSSVGADEEIMLIERRSEAGQAVLKQSDSVLHESEDTAGSDNGDKDRSSPCTAGGLHMPNSKSMKDFAQRVRRLRHHSQCTTEPELHEGQSGSSPEMDDGARVRRANSCPDMKKSPASSTKDNVSRTLDVTDEENNGERAASAMSNGIDSLPNQLVSIDTQTDNFWPMPYEHLFLGIFPTLGTTDLKTSPGSAPSSTTVSQDKSSQSSVYEVLDKYLETAIRGDEKDNVKVLKNQLQLMHQQLLFERHRREIHAFKNRRFLSNIKSTNVLEEHNFALKDQVQLLQMDLDNLRKQLENVQTERASENRTYIETITRLEDKCKTLTYNNKTVKDSEVDIRKELEVCKSECLSLTLEKQKVEAALMDALVEVKFAKEKALAGDKGREELEYANKQILLMGELQEKYEQRLADAQTLRRSDIELEEYKVVVNKEVQTLHEHLREQRLRLESCIQRITDLEAVLAQHEETICKQKRTLNSINEENDEKVKAVESKYQNQLTICRALEEKILELYKQIETSTKKPIRSPDTSSCQEVKVSSDKTSSGGAAGVSERSSPLSCSLASSEGSSALPHSEVREFRGLQANVGEESPSDTKPGTPKDFEMQPSTSSKID